MSTQAQITRVIFYNFGM